MDMGNNFFCFKTKVSYFHWKFHSLNVDKNNIINKKDANPLRLSIVLSHHMHRNWIEKSEAGCHWL